MEKQIIVKNGDILFLLKTFKCSRMQVWKALHFKAQSDEARRIRTLALKRGGELVGVVIPEFQTTHEEVEHTMTQTWGERVKLVANKDNGVVKVYVDGEMIRMVNKPSIPELMTLQQELTLMVKTL